MHYRTCRGLTITEVLVSIAVMAILLSLVMPALARGRSESGTTKSLANLQAINTALASYAAEFDGRQPTAVVDDFSTYGSSGVEAVINYAEVHRGGHPPVLLGDCGDDGMWGYYLPGNSGLFTPAANYLTIVPIEISGNSKFGFFRLINAKIMHDYLGGRWFDPRFYAPNDAAAYSFAEPFFDYPCEFASTSILPPNSVAYSSYGFSPAAMFDPQVLQSNAKGGYTNPYSYADGFRSPHIAQAKYPALKTRVMEHHWNQNTPPDRCNPAFAEAGSGYAGCGPWRFNHGAASAPATLFFDGSTRLLPNAEVLDADAQLIKQTGEGVWHRETPWGLDGYYSQYSFDGTILNHHILTTDGILGRDTLGPRP